MEAFQRYELKKDDQSNEYTLIIFADDYLAEFGEELGTIHKEKTSILAAAKKMLHDRYPNLKVKMIKVVVGGMAVTAIPFMMDPPNSAQAAGLSTTTVQTQTTSSVYYVVKSGDTLWNISQKYNSTVDQVKQANQLSSDSLNLNQKLIIPQTFHKVGTGDYLTVLAKKYNVSVDAIKEANNLTSDGTTLGQVLIIPKLITADTGTTSNSNSTPAASTNQTSKYTVVSGDSLFAIATRYGTTVDNLKNMNGLSSNTIYVGQVLTVSATDSTAGSVASQTYTVVSGDSLSLIAKKYNVTVDQIKESNKLTSDIIRVGQVLTIPNGQAVDTTTSSTNLATVQKNLQTLGYYAVPATTGNASVTAKEAIQHFQRDYLLPVTGNADEATTTAINHAIVKKALISDTNNYLGVPYVWGGTTPKGFDCSGFVSYMFNQHGVSMTRNTSAGMYNTGTAIQRVNLQPGDLVFFAVNSTGTISHVGFYMGDNQFISATSSKGIAAYSMDNSYWSQYYVGAKRVY